VIAYKLAIDSVVGHIEREVCDVGEINKRGSHLLEVPREKTPFLEPFVGGKILGELDSEIEIGRRALVTRFRA
jgi:hypothetical protein